MRRLPAAVSDAEEQRGGDEEGRSVEREEGADRHEREQSGGRRPAADRERVRRRSDEPVRPLDVVPVDERGEECAVGRVEVAGRGREREGRDHQEPERQVPSRPRTAIGTSSAPRKRSAAIIVRRRSRRSATSPPWRPKASAGTLSARRTAITPSGPPATSAYHISARYWNASPSSLIATAAYARRKPGAARSSSARAGWAGPEGAALPDAVPVGHARVLPHRCGDRLAAWSTRASLTGEDLAVEDVWRVAVERVPIELGDVTQTKIRAARELVERAAYGLEEHTYGVNTGFGRFHTVSIPAAHTEELQVRLLRSHACGVGEPVSGRDRPRGDAVAGKRARRGHSGAREETVELLVECLNRGVVPRVPSRGSVGASGDLAPLAHLALPLIGEGEAWVEGELLPGADALERVGLEPIRLQAKEGLSLINGTQFMAAYGALGLVRARRLAKVADLACALSVEALQGSRESFMPQIHERRPLKGQIDSAHNLLRLLEGSAVIEAHRWCDKVQDAYSLRWPRRCTAPRATSSTTSSTRSRSS